MKRAEFLFRTVSKNWSNYQDVMDYLRPKAENTVQKIGMAHWNQQQELGAKYLKKDGWEVEKIEPGYTSVDKRFFITIKLRLQTGYDVLPGNGYDDDYGGGFSPVPESRRSYNYEYAMLEVPDDLVEAGDWIIR